MLFVLLVVLTILFVIFVVRQLLLQRRITARQRAAQQKLAQTTEGGAYRAFVGDAPVPGVDRHQPTRGSNDDA